MQRLSARTLKEMLEQGQELHLLDVLPHSSFEKRHIPGAVNVPESEDGFRSKVEALVEDKSARIVVYCASPSCNASEKAAAELEKAGFENVADFEAGLQGWKKAGYALAGVEAR